jgi:Tfp pilus assembly protein FimT
MMKEFELRQARGRALEYGWPGRSVQSPNAKTGRFSGYWPSGRIAWKGAFVSGEQYGIWSYTSKDGKSQEERVYCNL